MNVLSSVQRAVALVLLTASLPAAADPSLSVVGYELASQKRLSNTVFEYTYRINVRNAGTDAEDVEVSLRATPDGISVVQREASIARLNAGSTGASTAEIVVRHDRTKPFRFEALEWAFRSRDATFTGKLPGASGEPALAAMKNYRARPQRQSVAIDAAGNTVNLSEVIVEFAQGATVGQVNSALDAVGAQIYAMSKGHSSVVLSIGDAGSLSGIDQRIKTLSQAPGVLSVWPSLNPRPLALPPNARFSNPTSADFYSDGAWGLGASRFIHEHLAIRAHSAWNLAGLLETPRLKERRPLMIYQDFFGGGPPGRTFDKSTNTWLPSNRALWNATVTPIDFKNDLPFDGKHGYGVMSIASAGFGGDETASALITGLYPAPLETRVVDVSNNVSQSTANLALIDLVAHYTTDVPAASRRNVIVNLSTGLCEDVGRCPEAYRFVAADYASEFTQLVQKRLITAGGAAAGFDPSFLIVYAAGNERSKWAYEDSWGAADSSLVLDSVANDPYVDLIHPGGLLAKLMLKPASANKDWSTWKAGDFTPELAPNGVPIRLDKLTNMIAVEARSFTDTRLVDLPGDPALNVPPSKRQLPPAIACPTPYTSKHGTVAAAGGVNNAVWLIYGPNGLPSAHDGTSFATPQVAATAAWIWSLAPDLKMLDVKELVRRSTALSAGAECGDQAEYADPIDLYAAVLSTDNPYGYIAGHPMNRNLGQTAVAPVRRWLLDVASVGTDGKMSDQPDGHFTQVDLLKFLQEFEKRLGDQTPDYSRYDLNGNGVTGEPARRQDYVNYSRFDFDGDFSWSTAAKSIEGVNRTFRENITTDLAVLIYYAYSPLYEGNEYERSAILLPYLQQLPSMATLFLNALEVTVPPSAGMSTQFKIGVIDPLGEQFSSLCNRERGVPLYSTVVAGESAGKSPAGKLFYWRPNDQTGRFQEKTANVNNCSSFIASLPGTGLIWINSAARNLDSGTNEDVEYQTRFYLGDPDLSEPASNTKPFEPSPRRRATQSLTYGRVSTPQAAFDPLFTTRDFSMGNLRFVEGAP